MKYWEIIADNLSKAGWSWGWISAVDHGGRTIWIVDAHREGKHFIVRADDILRVLGVGNSNTRVRDQLDLTRNKMPDGAARGVSKRLSGKCSN